MPLLLVFESIGTQELALIVIAALLLFGPRKLPELGRMLGKTLAEFRRASEDFKRTWQMEVEIEEAEKQRQTAQTPAAADAEISPEQDELTETPPAPPLVATPVDEAVARGSVHTAIVSSHDAATTERETTRETGERASQLVS